MAFEEKNEEISESLKCGGCGAMLAYQPGTDTLQCQYCGTVNKIEKDETAEIVSVDYATFLEEQNDRTHTKEAIVVQCSNCGAATTMLAGVTADSCPFCASPLVVNLNETKKILKPHYVLPFIVKKEDAVRNFQAWLKGLWFAPSDLLMKVKESSSQQLKGIYIPYWSYDTDTTTEYVGQRGEYYYVTETYRDSDGKTQTRQVRHTRWYPANGTVYCNFRDVLVSASDSLPQKMAEALEPWNLASLTGFDERFLSGFRAEMYRLDAEVALGVAKKRMDTEIREAICRHIGGDEQSITRYENEYENLALKYMLLPVWISAYKYDNKLYHFVVNACTGKVTGDRPYSWIKIALAVLLGLGLLALIIYFYFENK